VGAWWRAAADRAWLAGELSERQADAQLSADLEQLVGQTIDEL
jgi:hypothetical protein